MQTSRQFAGTSMADPLWCTPFIRKFHSSVLYTHRYLMFTCDSSILTKKILLVQLQKTRSYARKSGECQFEVGMDIVGLALAYRTSKAM